MITLKTLNRTELQNFVSSGKFAEYGFLPITEHRAASHIKNPKADAEDVLLTLAFDEDQLAGYLGTLPDFFMIDGKKQKFAWLSTLYVSEKFRGKKIAQKLLEKVFESYGNNIAITEFTKEAENLYNKTKQFDYIPPKTGKRYYFRTDFQTMVSEKKPKAKPFKPLFSAADFIIGSGISALDFFTPKPKFKYETLSSIDNESSAFLGKFPKNRTPEDISWFLENPWVLEAGKPEEKYLFSSYSKEFKYFWVKIYNSENQLSTCALLLLRDGHLKIPYLFSENDLKNFLFFLEWFIAEKKVKMLTSYQTELNRTIEEKGLRTLYQKDFERRYMFHKTLLRNLPKNFRPNFQDGDGDCALT